MLLGVGVALADDLIIPEIEEPNLIGIWEGINKEVNIEGFNSAKFTMNVKEQKDCRFRGYVKIEGDVQEIAGVIYNDQIYIASGGSICDAKIYLSEDELVIKGVYQSPPMVNEEPAGDDEEREHPICGTFVMRRKQ